MPKIPGSLDSAGMPLLANPGWRFFITTDGPVDKATMAKVPYPIKGATSQDNPAIYYGAMLENVTFKKDNRQPNNTNQTTDSTDTTPPLDSNGDPITVGDNTATGYQNLTYTVSDYEDFFFNLAIETYIEQGSVVLCFPVEGATPADRRWYTIDKVPGDDAGFILATVCHEPTWNLCTVLGDGDIPTPLRNPDGSIQRDQNNKVLYKQEVQRGNLSRLDYATGEVNWTIDLGIDPESGYARRPYSVRTSTDGYLYVLWDLIPATWYVWNSGLGRYEINPVGGGVTGGSRLPGTQDIYSLFISGKPKIAGQPAGGVAKVNSKGVILWILNFAEQDLSQNITVTQGNFFTTNRVPGNLEIQCNDDTNIWVGCERDINGKFLKKIDKDGNILRKLGKTDISDPLSSQSFLAFADSVAYTNVGIFPDGKLFFQPFATFVSQFQISIGRMLGLDLDDTSGTPITNVTNAAPAVITAPNHALRVGDDIQITNVFGTTSINVVGKVSATSFTANTIVIQQNGTDINANAPYQRGGLVLSLEANAQDKPKIVWSAFPPPNENSTTTQPKSPTLTANDITAPGTTGTDDAWVNPNNAQIIDGEFAQYTSAVSGQPGISNYLRCTGFDFSTVPDGVFIVGVTAAVTRQRTGSGTVIDSSVKLVQDGIIQGNEGTHTLDWSTTNNTTTISNVINASPAVITTPVAHGLIIGADIEITGVQGTTAVNVIGTVSSTSFTGTTFVIEQSGTDINGNAVYTGGGAVTKLKTITNVTNASPAVITCASHGLAPGNNVKITGVQGTTSVNVVGKVSSTGINSNAFVVSVNGVDINANAAYTSGGSFINLDNNTDTYTGSLDNSLCTWGLSLTTKDIKDPGFGIAISAATTGQATANIDIVSLTVYWSPTLPGDWHGNFLPGAGGNYIPLGFCINTVDSTLHIGYSGTGNSFGSIAPDPTFVIRNFIPFNDVVTLPTLNTSAINPSYTGFGQNIGSALIPANNPPQNALHIPNFMEGPLQQGGRIGLLQSNALFANNVDDDDSAPNAIAAWDNPNQGNTNDGQVASFTGSGASDYLTYANFGDFGFRDTPGAPTITGISVTVHCTGDCTDNSVMLIQNGSIGSVEHAMATPWPKPVLGDRSYGGRNDLWGLTFPDAASVNNNDLGVAISVKGSNAQVDYVTMTLYWTGQEIVGIAAPAGATRDWCYSYGIQLNTGGISVGQFGLDNTITTSVIGYSAATQNLFAQVNGLSIDEVDSFLTIQWHFFGYTLGYDWGAFYIPCGVRTLGAAQCYDPDNFILSEPFGNPLGYRYGKICCYSSGCDQLLQGIVGFCNSGQGTIVNPTITNSIDPNILTGDVLPQATQDGLPHKSYIGVTVARPGDGNGLQPTTVWVCQMGNFSTPPNAQFGGVYNIRRPSAFSVDCRQVKIDRNKRKKETGTQLINEDDQ